jgi:hypothetical protein
VPGKALFGSETNLVLHPFSGRKQMDHGTEGADPIADGVGQYGRHDQPGGVGGMPPPGKPERFKGQEDGQDGQGKHEPCPVLRIPIETRPRNDHRNDLRIRLLFRPLDCQLDLLLLFRRERHSITSFHWRHLLQNYLPLR